MLRGSSVIDDSSFYAPFIVLGWGLCLVFVWYAQLCVFSSFAIILTSKRELVAML